MSHRETEPGDIIRRQGMAGDSDTVQLGGRWPDNVQRVVPVLPQGLDGLGIPGRHADLFSQFFPP